MMEGLAIFLTKGAMDVISISKNEISFRFLLLFTKSRVISNRASEFFRRVAKSERGGRIGEQAAIMFPASFPTAARLLPLCGVPVILLR